MEEEIDLSKYLAVLVRRWWVIIGIALVCVLVAAMATYLQPKTYVAHGRLAVAETTWQVSFDTAIKSPIKDDEAFAADLQQRQTNFATLISNPATAEAVLSKLGDRLPPAERNLKALLTMVRGSAIKGSNLIDIAATSSDPEVAVLVVNAWAEEYVRQADSLAGNPEEEALTLVQSQTQSAKATYEKARATMEEALARDRSGELNRLIAGHEATIQALQSARDSVVLTLLHEIRRLERLQGDALAMRDQVQAGGQAAVASNGPALLLLKTQAFANSWEQEAQSQSGTALSMLLAQNTAQTTSVSVETMTSDLDALVAALGTRQSALEAELKSATTSLMEDEEGTFFPVSGGSEQGERAALGSQLATAIRDLEQRVRELRAQLSQEETRLKEAQAQRDLAWQIYDNLARKEAELTVAAQITDDQVRFAAPAAVALQTAGSTKSLALAAMVGLVAGIVAAFALEAWLNHRARAKARVTDN